MIYPCETFDISKFNTFLQNGLKSCSNTDVNAVGTAMSDLVDSLQTQALLTTNQRTITHRNIDAWVEAILSGETPPSWELEGEPLP